MKIVVVSDLHVHPYRLCSRDGGVDRLRDGLSCLRQSLELARTKSAAWVFAGDFKGPKTQWPQEALTGSHEILREYGDVEKIMLPGNHDARGIGGTGLAPFWDVAHVVEEAEYVRAGDATLLCLPWDAPPRTDKRADVPIVAHGFLSGCMLGPEDVRIAKGRSVAEYGDFPVAFFGDVHKGQWRHRGVGGQQTWYAYKGEGQVRRPGPWAGEVLYAGSPYPQNWGERDDPPKGALLADLGTGEVTLHVFEAPRFRHFEIATDHDLEAFVKNREQYRGDFVRVVYSGPPSMVVKAAENLGDQFRSFQFIARRVQKTVKRAEIHAGMPVPEIIRNYVAAHPPQGLDPDRTLEAMVRLSVNGD
jgi:hypothetical protein